MVPSCSYPGPSFSKGFSVSDCQDTFTGLFSIPQLSENCSFTSQSTSDSQILEGKIHVSAIDNLGSFRGTPIQRTTRSVLLVNIQLPTRLTLESGNLTIAAPVDLLAAVSFQEYNYDLDTIDVVLVTSVQWPYQLSLPSLVSSSPFPDFTFTEGTNNCPQDVPASDCFQETVFSISNVRSSSCQLDGVYTFDFPISCRSSVAPSDCPFQGGETTTVNATLQSEDLCGMVTIVSSLSGDLQTFGEESLTEESISFVGGQRIYFKATLNADVEILDAQVDSITIVQGASTQTIVAGGGEAGLYVGTINFDGDLPEASGPNELGFAFDATFGTEASDIFDSSSPGSIPFSVEVGLSVSYRTF